MADLKPPTDSTSAGFGPAGYLHLGLRTVPLQFVRHRRAKRYILRLTVEGTARVTIPRGGSEAAARLFAERHHAWLARQLDRRASQPPPEQPWSNGTEVWFRGEKVPLVVDTIRAAVCFANQSIPLRKAAGNLRPVVESHLRWLAESELPARTFVLAALHGCAVRRVRVANQRSRWGSCSARGTISLNWRLVQTPLWVRDYLILHELMHLREMNHSPRFWRHVEQVCPDYQTAELWLRRYSRWLR